MKHYLIDPFSGSYPLCGARAATYLTMNKSDVDCPDCTALFGGSKAVASEMNTASLQATAEQEWRKAEPAAASLWDRLNGFEGQPGFEGPRGFTVDQNTRNAINRTLAEMPQPVDKAPNPMWFYIPFVGALVLAALSLALAVIKG